MPGTRFTWKGHALDEGELIKSRVVFTVTDLTKVIDGVETVVAWDRDYTDGALEEAELAFFAQDDDGNVWHFGEYPEEYDGKKLVKTPVWLAGLARGSDRHLDAGGSAAWARPSYAQGWGRRSGWNDRARWIRSASTTAFRSTATPTCWSSTSSTATSRASIS